MRHPQRRGYRVGVGALVAAALYCVAVATAGATASPETASLAVVLFVGGTRRDLGGLVGSIATGALALGAVAWIVVSQTNLLSLSVPVATGLGLAVGGGLGSVVWLLSVGEPEDDSTETVTVDMADDDAPTPEPVDLFEASPEPILYYADDDEGPVVRAVNPAFERVFGVSASAREGTPLAAGSQAGENGDAIVEAARAGDGFDEVLACETPDGARRMRLRIAATGGGERAEGYVLYADVTTD